MIRLNSIRFKTNILFTFILGIILIAYSWVIFLAEQRALYRDLEESLRVKATEIADIVFAYEQIKRVESHPASLLSDILGGEHFKKRAIVDQLWQSQIRTLNLKSDYINIANSAGQSVYISENFKKDVEALFDRHLPFSPRHMAFHEIRDERQKLRLYGINLPLFYGGRLFMVVQVATPEMRVSKVLNRTRFFMIISVILVLGLTSFLGGFFVTNILRPVRKITEFANNISHKDLNVRIDDEHADEEIKYLIDSLNTMLRRLEKAFAHINEFSSHVAHELKTPLAIIRGEMELAMGEDRDREEYKRVLSVSLEEVDRLIRIIKDLLLLAKLDYQPDIFKFELFDLSEFIRDVYNHSKILGMEKNIDVSLEAPVRDVRIQGDRTHLRRLFFNLINNAVKFTPANGKVTMTLQLRGRKAVVTISDSGVGIPPEDLSKLFTKFFRGHRDDPGIEPGNGLGLSIAQAIARAHNGEITATSELNKGSTFTVTLPLA